VIVASFIACQRTDFQVPHVLSCRALSVSTSWFYKWKDRKPTARQLRRRKLDAAVKASFEDSERTYGSPRVREDLVEDGWAVSKKTIEQSMAAQGLCGRPKRRRHNLTRPDKAAAPLPDLVKRDFTAPTINAKWCGDLTEIPTEAGKLYLAAVLDLGSRRVPGFSLSEHHDAAVATSAIQMAAATRGGNVAGVVFHSDKGSEYNAELFAAACTRLGVTRSMGRVGSCFDCRSRILQLDARVRAAQPPSLCDQGRREKSCRRVHRPLPHDAAAQLVRNEVTSRLRGDPRATSSRHGQRGASGMNRPPGSPTRPATVSSGPRVRVSARLNQLNESLHDSGGSPCWRCCRPEPPAPQRGRLAASPSREMSSLSQQR
jgi:putative transposase